MKAHVPEPAKMTLNQASRELDAKLLDAVNYSGLPLRLVELQLLNLLHAVQDKLSPASLLREPADRKGERCQ